MLEPGCTEAAGHAVGCGSRCRTGPRVGQRGLILHVGRIATGPPHYGRIYVGFAEFNGQGRSPIDIAYSDDNGASWTGPVRVSDSDNQFDQDARPSVAPNGDVLMTWSNSPNEKSLTHNVTMADISHDGGASWGADATVSPIPGAYSGLPNSLYRDSTDVWSTTDSKGRLVVVPEQVVHPGLLGG